MFNTVILYHYTINNDYTRYNMKRLDFRYQLVISYSHTEFGNGPKDRYSHMIPMVINVAILLIHL